MYKSYFGLADKPFKLSPDPKYFYESSLHGKAISYLRYGLEVGEGFIVVTGPVGTGKTTIARSLLASLNDSILAAQIATTKLTPDELVKLVAAKFGLEVEGLGKAEILKRFEVFLYQLNSQGRRALLIIDEAQNLPSETIEELRMLSNFQIDDRPLIQSFLLGQEELKPIIELPEMEQFRQRIIASCHLTPFTKEETKNYIIHRMKRAGWKDRPIIEPKAFKVIANYTAGTPRKINIFMDRLFLYAFLESVESIGVKDVEHVIEEMGGELSGGLQIKRVSSGNRTMITTTSGAKDTINTEKIHQTLFEVDKILDDVVSRKTLTIKHLDRLIREKRKTLSEPEPEPESKEKVNANRLIEKNWLQQLLKEKEADSNS